MCRAFSCIVDQAAKVTWKLGVDSHKTLLAGTTYKDNTADSALMEFARVEITPNNGSYLEPDVWTLKVDQTITPVWFTERHKDAARKAHAKWLAKLDKILIRKKIIHPFNIAPPAEITKKHISMLRQWASVWDSVGDSVWASVRASVGDSVWAYTGSFFSIPQWKYIKHPKGRYPYGPCVSLWKLGLVSSFDGKTWRLHGGPKAAILFEITAEELRK